MNLKIFSIRDTKVGAFMRPYFARSTAEGIRYFEAAATDQNSVVARYPNDMILFEIGEFDEQSGTIRHLDSGIVNLGLASEHIKVDVNPRQPNLPNLEAVQQ